MNNEGLGILGEGLDVIYFIYRNCLSFECLNLAAFGTGEGVSRSATKLKVTIFMALSTAMV